MALPPRKASVWLSQAQRGYAERYRRYRCKLFPRSGLQLWSAPKVSGVGSREASKAWPQIEDHRELKAKGLLHGLENSLRVISKGATGTKCFEDNL